MDFKQKGIVLINYVFIVLLCLIPTYAAAADELALYVQGTKTSVYSQPLLRSPLLGELRQGGRITPFSRTGNWYRIIFNEREGYVSSFAVAPYPPITMPVETGDGRAKSGDNPRGRRSSAPTIVAGVKGLTYEERMRRHEGQKADFATLDIMEGVRIEPVELDAFAERARP